MKNFKSSKVVLLVCVILFVLVNLNSVLSQPVNINLTQEAQYQYTPMVAISHTDPNKAVCVWRDYRVGRPKVGYSFTTNGGVIWSSPFLLDSTLVGNSFYTNVDPHVCVDGSGNFYVVVKADNIDAVYKSTDGGRTFPVAYQIPLNSVTPFIVCDLNPSSPFFNTIYVAVAAHLLSKSTNGGINWSTPVSTNQGGHGPNIAISPNGQLNQVSMINIGSAAMDIVVYNRSTDGGDSFGQNSTLDSGWSLNSLFTAFYPSIACDISGGLRNGYIYCVYSNEGHPGSGNGGVEAYMVRSTDFGTTWSQYERVTVDPLNGTDFHIRPYIAVNNTGRIAISYYDTRNSPPPPPFAQSMCEAWLSRSDDGGITFTNEKLSTALMPRGVANYLNAIDYWDNTLIPVWTDLRDTAAGNREIYTCIMGNDSVSGMVTYRDNNQPVTHGNVKALYFDNSTGNIITVDSTMIQPDGHYTLRHVPQDSLDIMFYQNDDNLDFVPTYYISTVDWKQATKIYADHNLTNVNGQVYRINNTSNPYHISGFAFKYPAQGPPNFPLKDAIIYAMIGTDYKNYGISNGSGVYMTDNLPSGTYTLMGYRMGYNPVMQYVTIANNSQGNINFYFGGSPLGIEGTEIPTRFKLYQNYPNPFNPETSIKFDIPKTQNVKIVIYDIMGREVNKPVDQELKPGAYSIKWDGTNFASGVYFYRIDADNFVQVKKMLLIK